jgi:hypothetical protein
LFLLPENKNDDLKPWRKIEAITGGVSDLDVNEKDILVACKNGEKQFYLQREFFDSIKSFNSLCKINEISPRPILLVQGSDDKKVLAKETALLFRNAKGLKEIHFIQGAGHSFAFFEDQLFEITLRHLGKWNL